MEKPADIVMHVRAVERWVNDAKQRVGLRDDFVERVFTAAMSAFGVTREEICGKDRHIEIVLARFSVQAALVELGMTTIEIGRITHKDHGCVTNAKRQIGPLLASKKLFAAQHARFLEELKQTENKQPIERQAQ